MGIYQIQKDVLCCDVCKEQIDIKGGICEICGKDLCSDCQKEIIMGRVYYTVCSKCYYKAHEKMNNIYNDYQKAIEELLKRIKGELLNER